MDAVSDYLDRMVTEALRLENSKEAGGESAPEEKTVQVKSPSVKRAPKERSASPNSKSRSTRSTTRNEPRSGRKSGSPVKKQRSDTSPGKKRGRTDASPGKYSDSIPAKQNSEMSVPLEPPKDIVYTLIVETSSDKTQNIKEPMYTLYDYDSVNAPFTELGDGTVGADSEEILTICHHDDEPLHRCMGHHQLPILWEDSHGDQVNPGKGDQNPVAADKAVEKTDEVEKGKSETA